MSYDYRETIEGKRRFSNPEIYRKSLEFQKEMQKLGVAWHNQFADECTHDFCCCEGDNLMGSDYKHYIPSFRTVLKDALDDLFEVCKHGDEDHQNWLRDKFNEYLKEF